MSVRRRIETLERLMGASAGWQEEAQLTDEELLARVEGWLEVAPGTISRTAEEAEAKGYANILAEIAALAGVELAALKAAMDEAAAEREATHEWRQRGGRVYVRPLGGARL